MFGSPMMEHEQRYEYAAEWIEVVKKLWTAEEEFDFEGRFFKIEKGFHQPKPLQRPHPPIMNAGSSPTGARFAAKYADVAFFAMRDEEIPNNAPALAALRKLGREEFNREFQIWANGWVVCRTTEKEAQDYVHHFIYEKGDWAAADNLVAQLGIQHAHIPPAVLERVRYRFLAGWGGLPLVGTPAQIVDKLRQVSAVGVDGLVLSWVDYGEGLEQWGRDVMPLLEQAGLRKPFSPN
jgi:alkanesulfonate monooxygenase SsuD/methylene tetrahydromethanopterin reductase-like flavin-dependent oxidoreductase (luciferase family)